MKWKLWNTIEMENTDVYPKERVGRGNRKPYITRQGRITTTHAYTPKKTKASMLNLKKNYMRFMVGRIRIRSPIQIRFSFTLMTKRKYSPTKADLDNIYKTITDAAKGMLWDDDGQIVSWGETNIHHGCKTPGLLMRIEYRGDLY